MRAIRSSAAVLILVTLASVQARAQDPSSYTDPPGRVGRVSDMTGNVSLYPAGATDWSAATLNYPLSGGDALWADAGGRAEVHLGSSAIRMGAQTSITFGEVSDTVTQVRLDQGTIDVHVRFLNDNEVYEIDTPSGVISLVDEGHYRVDVSQDGRRTILTVRDGDAAIERNDGGQPWDVRAGSAVALSGTNGTPVAAPPAPVDDWERWADGRDQREDDAQSTQYVSRDMVGYEDLDQYGGWSVEANYGNVWYPRTVQAGWAPYRYGHWSSVGPWGWTWIDDAPWGFAPFHYGRWAYVRNRWGWVPGPIQLRPVYAPALVAFVGGAGWGASFSAGGGAPVGWVPLAPGEAYTPGFRASPRYLNRVNFVARGAPPMPGRGANDFRYANRDAPGAFTAVPRDVFIRSRPVPTATIAVRPADIVSARPAAPPTPAPRGGPPARGDDRGDGGNVPHPPAPAGGGRSAIPTPPSTPWRGRPMPSQTTPTRGGGNADGRGDARGGRGNNDRGGPPPAQAPTQPPTTPTVNQPPTAGTPPMRQPPRPSGPPGQQPPPAPVPTTQPAPAQNQPPQPGQPGRPSVRPAPPTALDNSPDWQRDRAQLVARQQQEAADLARRRAVTPTPAAKAPAPAQQQQVQAAAEQKALLDRQQQQRDQMDKQARRQPAPPPPPPQAPPVRQPPPPPPPPAPPKPAGRPKPAPAPPPADPKKPGPNG